MSFKSVRQLEIQCICRKYSKTIIDQIDNILEEHCRFTNEEVDLLLIMLYNYRKGMSLKLQKND